MNTKWIQKKLPYTGQELRHLFAYEQFGISGDSMVAWVGPCDIALDDMVDGEDRFEKATIRGDLMLHFVGEFFHPDIFFAVAVQRLFATICKDVFESSNSNAKIKLTRSGDDLYHGRKKLSISIASIGHFSSMLHFAMNITNQGTPVETCALGDFQIDPAQLAKKILEQFRQEYESIVFATQKVSSID